MFLNLIMLAGIGGALVPLVLHLLARARYRTVDWGAMMFLESADPRQSHAARLREWSLLALRMLLVGLLAVALARPVVTAHSGGGGGSVDAQSRVSAVILIDCSPSMSLEEAGRSRFDRARQAALQVLASFRRGDEVTLIPLGGAVETPPAPATDFQAVARAVADLQIRPGVADVAAGIGQAQGILNDLTFARREVHLITDRQAVNWNRLAAGSGEAVRRWLGAPRFSTRLYVIPVGGEEPENVALEAVELVPPVAVRGVEVEAEVRLRNYAGRPHGDLELALWDTGPDDAIARSGDYGRPVAVRTVTVGARATTSVRIPVAFDRAGSHVLRARLKSPGLQSDDVFHRAIDVIDPPPVLIVSGDEPADERRRESFFLRLALAPYQATQVKQPDRYAVTVIRAEELPRADLDRYQVMLLADVPLLTAEQTRAIEQRVYDGAGLIVAPGNLSRADAYNALLYRDAQGLLPARLQNPAPPDRAEPTTLLSVDREHPLFRFRRAEDRLPDVVVGRYFPAAPVRAGARTLATFASGDPFVVEGVRGRGTVLLLTTPLNAEWSALPFHPFYLPFVQSLVNYAAAASRPQRNLLVGEPLAADLQAPEDLEVQLTRNGERVLLPSGSFQSQFRFTDTRDPGIYRLASRRKSGGRTSVSHYVVRAPAEESDLTPLTDAQWEQLEQSFTFERIDESVTPLALRLSAERRGRELWLPLLVAVLGLGVAEMWLSGRLSGGRAR